MGTTTLTVDGELADELESFGGTRDEQLEAVLELARSAQGTGRAMKSNEFEQKLSQYHGDVNVEEVYDELEGLRNQLEDMERMLNSVPGDVASKLQR